MKLYDYINIRELEDMLNSKMVNKSAHPLHNGIVMYNYSKECVNEKCWNDTTMKCRGLIVDKNNNIIARPIPKFFNYEEHLNEVGGIDKIPVNEPFKVFEKLDGSLGILYWIDDVPYITTKGSFESEQGYHATQILHTKYKNVWSKLNKNWTYMFEIIYPEDKHVVKYPGIDDIFLLAVFDNESVKEYDLSDFEGLFPQTHTYDNIKDWSTLREDIDGENREGFVIRFESGFRIKLKYEQYFKLHYMRNTLTRKKIVQYFIDGESESLMAALSEFDEEDRIVFGNIVDDLRKEYATIYNKSFVESKNANFETRKENAQYILSNCTYPSIVFAILYNGPVGTMVWKQVKNNLKNE